MRWRRPGFSFFFFFSREKKKKQKEKRQGSLRKSGERRGARLTKSLSRQNKWSRLGQALSALSFLGKINEHLEQKCDITPVQHQKGQALPTAEAPLSDRG